jgi:hypothetical protein
MLGRYLTGWSRKIVPAPEAVTCRAPGSAATGLVRFRLHHAAKPKSRYKTTKNHGGVNRITRSSDVRVAAFWTSVDLCGAP